MTLLLSDNGISRVWREGAWVYKRQLKYLTDNEFYALSVLEYTGYVPRYVERIDVSTVRMEFIKSAPITDCAVFKAHYEPILSALQHNGLRHDDLTTYAVLNRGNCPVLIDWAESRTIDDPRPSKRSEGDAYWLKHTMEESCAKEHRVTTSS